MIAVPAFSMQPTKRRVFFSFHFDDIMRVNNVRQVWKIDHPDAPTMRSFYDSSLWEARQLEGDDALKRLIREGQTNTSAVCVLIGTYTWQRRWVRYEIARAIIDGRGLLGVHLNSIKHHRPPFLPHLVGENPFNHLSIGKVQENFLAPPKYYIFEKTTQGWIRYQDHTDSVSLPCYLADPNQNYVTPLSTAIPVYDFAHNDGHKHLGAWIDQAAITVGR